MDDLDVLLLSRFDRIICAHAAPGVAVCARAASGGLIDPDRWTGISCVSSRVDGASKVLDCAEQLRAAVVSLSSRYRARIMLH